MRDIAIKPLQLTAEAIGQCGNGLTIGGGQLRGHAGGKPQLIGRNGGHGGRLTAAGKQNIEACRLGVAAKKALLAGPQGGDLGHLILGEVVGDQQQTGLFSRGQLLHGKFHRPCRVAALQRHDIGAQVGQQQRKGLMIPGWRHGEVGVACVEDQRNALALGAAQQLL